MKALLACFIFLCLLPAQDVKLPELVATLDGRYNSIQSWQADFTQIYTSGMADRTESGHLYLQKPGRMRWDYKQPAAKVFIVNGKKIWQYTAGDSTATLTEIKNDTDLRTPLRYLLGHTDLNQELADLSFSSLPPWHPGDYVIHGRPHPGEVAGWNEVWIEVSRAYEIDRLVIVGSDGSRNDIRLSQIRVNAPLPRRLFDFVPPPGVKIVPGSS